jgi:predicted short-subunit dehydrogenase-like oxidoreductase (DUF2520 family)
MLPSNVSIIGSGNLAWHLAPALDNAGFVVKEVFSRNPRHAEALTERLYQADVKATLDFSTSESTVFILAVKDDAIRSIAQEIVLPEDALLLHTSGSQSINELQFAACAHVGVLYPLQTFSKSRRINFRTVPFFIETNSAVAEKIVIGVAKALSDQVTKITSHERRALHVAAVFASNFSNQMLAISQAILQQNSIDFAFLKPLIEETIQKSLTIGPKQAQTGPASRGDLQILDQHMDFLQENTALAEIYKVVSQHILNQAQG